MGLYSYSFRTGSRALSSSTLRVRRGVLVPLVLLKRRCRVAGASPHVLSEEQVSSAGLELEAALLMGITLRLVHRPIARRLEELFVPRRQLVHRHIAQEHHGFLFGARAHARTHGVRARLFCVSPQRFPTRLFFKKFFFFFGKNELSSRATSTSRVE